MAQFDITVKIRVTVTDELDPNTPHEEATVIAQHWAEMALKYKSVGADEIVSVAVEETVK